MPGRDIGGGHPRVGQERALRASYGQHHRELRALKQDALGRTARSFTKCKVSKDKLVSSPQKATGKFYMTSGPDASVQGEEHA